MEKQGSWVAMCMDNKNRLIVSDQYGGIYRFPVPASGKNIDPASIEQITYAPERTGMGKPTDAQKKLPMIGHAQGLCYAFDSLYVVVNSRSSSTGAGVFRLLDTNKDDKFDKIVTIKKHPAPVVNTARTPFFLLLMANIFMWSWATKPIYLRTTPILGCPNYGAKINCTLPYSIS